MTSLWRRLRDTAHPGSLLALVIVAVLFGLGQFLTMDMERFFAWDEAAYFSQASPQTFPMGPGPHRARGITWILSPVALLTDSIPLIRAYLASISTLALFGAFLVWRSLYHWVSPLGASLFGFSWLALGYGSEIMPNLWSAFGAVAATGFIALGVSRSDRKWQVGAAIAVMAVTVVRPLDGAVLLVVTLVTVAINRTDRGRRLGLWVIVGSLRYHPLDH